MQEGDPESSTGLSRALFIQCSQLSGHIAVLLRCLCVSLTAAIDSNVKASQIAGKTAGHEYGQRGELSSNAPLLSGLLLVGRLSWLLKIRGRFLEEALLPALPSFSSSSSTPSNSSDAGICGWTQELSSTIFIKRIRAGEYQLIRTSVDLLPRSYRQFETLIFFYLFTLSICSLYYLRPCVRGPDAVRLRDS